MLDGGTANKHKAVLVCQRAGLKEVLSHHIRPAAAADLHYRDHGPFTKPKRLGGDYVFRASCVNGRLAVAGINRLNGCALNERRRAALHL